MEKMCVSLVIEKHLGIYQSTFRRKHRDCKNSPNKGFKRKHTDCRNSPNKAFSNISYFLNILFYN